MAEDGNPVRRCKNLLTPCLVHASCFCCPVGWADWATFFLKASKPKKTGQKNPVKTFAGISPGPRQTGVFLRPDQDAMLDAARFLFKLKPLKVLKHSKKKWFSDSDKKSHCARCMAEFFSQFLRLRQNLHFSAILPFSNGFEKFRNWK